MCCHRHFGLPRQLDPHERVWLMLDGANGVEAVVLNDYPLNRGDGAGDALEIEVTPLLVRRNHLQVVTVAPAGDAQLWEEIALEIRCAAFLRGVRVQVEAAGDQAVLRVGGIVAGAAETSLEVYVLAGGRSVGYTVVTAGASFEIVSEPVRREQLAAGPVRVELVCGAVVWHEVEKAV